MTRTTMEVPSMKTLREAIKPDRRWFSLGCLLIWFGAVMPALWQPVTLFVILGGAVAIGGTVLTGHATSKLLKNPK